MIFKKTLTFFFILLIGAAFAQQLVKKPFINSLEVFAGTGLSFNYGNKFIENYEDENISNERLTKVGYLVGFGAIIYPKKLFEIQIRFQHEQKGTKNKLISPTLPDGNKLITYSDYKITYNTVSISPRFWFGKNNNICIGLGAYLSKTKVVEGYSKVFDTYTGHSSEGYFNGRYFFDLADNGSIQSLTWMPGLTGISKDDFGLLLSVGYRFSFNQRHGLIIQVQDMVGLNNLNRNNPYDLKEFNHSLSFILSYFIIPSKI
ncbi:MAG: hypothetical protein L6Q51_13645 [Cyclobacteriaceae bacterium]|nr:hypothetical protein [Cyclobacteriaceae bacterium]